MQKYLFKAKIFDKETNAWRWEIGGCLKNDRSAYILAKSDGKVPQCDPETAYVCGLFSDSGCYLKDIKAPINVIPCDPNSVCIWSMQSDKNGISIWEQDIVMFTYKSLEVYGIVKMDEYSNSCDVGKHLGFYIDWQDKYLKNALRKDLTYWLPDISVVGNMIDNPELIRKKIKMSESGGYHG